MTVRRTLYKVQRSYKHRHRQLKEQLKWFRYYLQARRYILIVFGQRWLR